MANEQNLVRGEEAHKLTAEELSRGGKASVESRRRKKDLRLALEMLLEKDFKNKNGQTLSGAEALALKQFDKAMKGDTKAFEVIRDTAGQKPVDKVMISEVDQSVIDEVESMVLNDESESGD